MSELTALRDARTMAARGVRLSTRHVDALVTSLMLPVMLMLLFVYLFGGAIQTGTRHVTYVVPGVLLLCAGFGASMTAVGVTTDMTAASSTGSGPWTWPGRRSWPGTSRPAWSATSPPPSWSSGWPS